MTTLNTSVQSGFIYRFSLLKTQPSDAQLGIIIFDLPFKQLLTVDQNADAFGIAADNGQTVRVQLVPTGSQPIVADDGTAPSYVSTIGQHTGKALHVFAVAS